MGGPIDCAGTAIRWREHLGEFGIGQPVSRLEDPRLLRGEGEFVDDMRFTNEAYAYVLRSPRPHANILGIDTSTARAYPGVLTVLTGADAVADGLGTIPQHRAAKQA